MFIIIFSKADEVFSNYWRRLDYYIEINHCLLSKKEVLKIWDFLKKKAAKIFGRGAFIDCEAVVHNQQRT